MQINPHTCMNIYIYIYILHTYMHACIHTTLAGGSKKHTLEKQTKAGGCVVVRWESGEGGERTVALICPYVKGFPGKRDSQQGLSQRPLRSSCHRSQTGGLHKVQKPRFKATLVLKGWSLDTHDPVVPGIGPAEIRHWQETAPTSPI